METQGVETILKEHLMVNPMPRHLKLLKYFKR